MTSVKFVIPAKAGIQPATEDNGFRRNDELALRLIGSWVWY